MEQCTETRICCHQPGCWRWNDGGLLRSEDSLCGRIDQNHIGAMQFFCTGGFLKLSLATKTFLASIKYISVSTFNSYSLCHITLLHSTQFMDSFFFMCIWWKCYPNIFTAKNVDQFSTLKRILHFIFAELQNYIVNMWEV